MIIDFPTLYDTSISYYGIGFFWTNAASNEGGAAAVVTPKLRTLLGVGL